MAAIPPAIQERTDLLSVERLEIGICHASHNHISPEERSAMAWSARERDENGDPFLGKPCLTS